MGAAVVELCYGPLADNPARLGKPLRFELEGLHCVRRGDYRAIYRIDLGRHHVEIVAIEHRSDAYRTSMTKRDLIVLLAHQADPGLRDDLAALAGETTDDLDPIR